MVFKSSWIVQDEVTQLVNSSPKFEYPILKFVQNHKARDKFHLKFLMTNQIKIRNQQLISLQSLVALEFYFSLVDQVSIEVLSYQVNHSTLDQDHNTASWSLQSAVALELRAEQVSNVQWALNGGTGSW